MSQQSSSNARRSSRPNVGTSGSSNGNGTGAGARRADASSSGQYLYGQLQDDLEGQEHQAVWQRAAAQSASYFYGQSDPYDNTTLTLSMLMEDDDLMEDEHGGHDHEEAAMLQSSTSAGIMGIAQTGSQGSKGSSNRASKGSRGVASPARTRSSSHDQGDGLDAEAAGRSNLSRSSSSLGSRGSGIIRIETADDDTERNRGGSRGRSESMDGAGSLCDCCSLRATCRRLWARLFPAPCNMQRSIIFNDGSAGLLAPELRFPGTYRAAGKFTNRSAQGQVLLGVDEDVEPDNLLQSHSHDLSSSAHSVSLAAELGEPAPSHFTPFRPPAHQLDGTSTAPMLPHPRIQRGHSASSAVEAASGLWLTSAPTPEPGFTHESAIKIVPDDANFPTNAVNNQKYSLITFIPLFLYYEFRFFFNLYFLVVALTQFVPALQVGFLFTYVAPLCFVLAVSMAKEAYDDVQRHRRDRVVNNEMYLRLTGDASTIVNKGGSQPNVLYEEGATFERVPARDLRVGDIIVLHANQRIPSDCVLLRTSDKQGTCFIRTDQLDGETDWKIRRAVLATQKLPHAGMIFRLHAELNVEAPKLDIYDFAGNFKYYGLTPAQETAHAVHHDVSDRDALAAESARQAQYGAAPEGVSSPGFPRIPSASTISSSASIGSSISSINSLGPGAIASAAEVPEMTLSSPLEENRCEPSVEPLTLENVVWASTVVASGTVIACVVYTGLDTRSQRNASVPKTKTGLLDLEVNSLSKILFVITMILAFTMTALKGLHGEWYIYMFRFVLLLSSIIPISLRVNLDLAKTYYSVVMMRDEKIPNTVVRTSTIPEELGRLSYIFTDKTGTLTCNEMVFKTLVVGLNLVYPYDRMGDLIPLAQRYTWTLGKPATPEAKHNEPATVPVSPDAQKVGSLLLAIALCHNVTPVVPEASADDEEESKSSNSESVTEFQASSPDEVALVKFTQQVGLQLIARSQHSITLKTPRGRIAEFEILSIFPFSSDTKRMGIIVREPVPYFDSHIPGEGSSNDVQASVQLQPASRIVFYLKGAETVMKERIVPSDWLNEELDTMASAGLRTLVYARKYLGEDEYASFATQLNAARAVLEGRSEAIQLAMQRIEHNMELLGITGVDDRLQPYVSECLERLREARIRTWMLTGDKAETAACIARSATLVARTQRITTISTNSERDLKIMLDNFSASDDGCLLIDGPTLHLALNRLPWQFLSTACRATSVICCRCAPTQKAQVVSMMKQFTGKRVCAIGDGGNDVAMIQAADVGVGIVGKEGLQAAMAADFSIQQFSHLERLILWHGRNSYKRSARLAQFVMHRGLIISIIQAVFSALFFFAAVPIYNGWLMVGYTTVYTMLPVFSLVLDQDISEASATLYPLLYTDLQKGRPLSFKTFFIWVFLSVYQGGLIMILAITLFESSIVNIVAITFTALVLCELANVALSIHRWTKTMVAAQIVSIIAYAVSMVVLRTYFDLAFILTGSFAWKTIAVTMACTLPPTLVARIMQKINPPAYTKVSQAGTLQLSEHLPGLVSDPRPSGALSNSQTVRQR